MNYENIEVLYQGWQVGKNFDHASLCLPLREYFRIEARAKIAKSYNQEANHSDYNPKLRGVLDDASLFLTPTPLS